MKSDDVEGRVIHMAFHVTLTPQNTQHLGETDMALEYGHGLIREVFMMLKAAAEAEGFQVDINATNVVY